MNIINGMTVLEQNMIQMVSMQTNVLICLCVLIPVVILIYYCIMAFVDIKRNNIDFNILTDRCVKICIFCAIIAIISGFLPGSTTDTGRYEYKCLFEDYVTVNDITEVYDIISVEDDIWTVQDKNIAKR